jgi:predicted CoA-binding protein
VTGPGDDELRRLYAEAETLAVVGCSPNWSKPSCVVPSYMQSQGYRIVPVNPRERECLGEPSVDSLAEVAVPVDVVVVFRPAEEAPGIARAAAALGMRCLWLQTGIVSDEARGIAEQAGLAFVADRCIGVTHGELGFGPGVGAWKRQVEEARAPG